MDATCKTEVNFKGLEGQMIQGSINPAVPDVSITLNREGQVIAEFESDETGSITYGPVPKGSYEISLFKQDYNFERVEG